MFQLDVNQVWIVFHTVFQLNVNHIHISMSYHHQASNRQCLGKESKPKAFNMWPWPLSASNAHDPSMSWHVLAAKRREHMQAQLYLYACTVYINVGVGFDNDASNVARKWTPSCNLDVAHGHQTFVASGTSLSGNLPKNTRYHDRPWYAMNNDRIFVVEKPLVHTHGRQQISQSLTHRVPHSQKISEAEAANKNFTNTCCNSFSIARKLDVLVLKCPEVETKSYTCAQMHCKQCHCPCHIHAGHHQHGVRGCECHKQLELFLTWSRGCAALNVWEQSPWHGWGVVKQFGPCFAI